MKKLLIIILSLLFVGTLTSCNQKIVDFEYDNYHTLHYIPENKDYKIKQWTNNDMGVKVKLEDGSIAFFSEGTYVLWGDECKLNHGDE